MSDETIPIVVEDSSSLVLDQRSEIESDTSVREQTLSVPSRGKTKASRRWNGFWIHSMYETKYGIASVGAEHAKSRSSTMNGRNGAAHEMSTLCAVPETTTQPPPTETSTTTIEEIIEALPWCRSLVYYVTFYCICSTSFALNIGYIFFLLNLLLYPYNTVSVISSHHGTNHQDPSSIGSSSTTDDALIVGRDSIPYLRCGIVLLHFGAMLIGCCSSSRILRRFGCRPVLCACYSILASLSIVRLILSLVFFNPHRVRLILLGIVPVHAYFAAVAHSAAQRLYYDIIPTRKQLKTLPVILVCMIGGSWWLSLALLIGGETSLPQRMLIEGVVFLFSLLSGVSALLVCESPRFLEHMRPFHHAKEMMNRILTFSDLPPIDQANVVEREWNAITTSSFYEPLDVHEMKQWFLTRKSPGSVLLGVYALVGYLLYTMLFSSDGLTMLPSIAEQDQGSIAGSIMLYELMDIFAARYARRKSKYYPGAQVTCGTALLLVALCFIFFPHFWPDFWLLLARFSISVTLYATNFISSSIFPLRVRDNLTIFSSAVFFGATIGIAPMRLLVEITSSAEIERWTVVALCMIFSVVVLWVPSFDPYRITYDAKANLNADGSIIFRNDAHSITMEQSRNARKFGVRLSSSKTNRPRQHIYDHLTNARHGKDDADVRSNEDALPKIVKTSPPRTMNRTTAPEPIRKPRRSLSPSISIDEEMDQELLSITGTKMRI